MKILNERDWLQRKKCAIRSDLSKFISIWTDPYMQNKQPCEWDENSDTIKKIYRWNLLSFALALRRWSSQQNRLTCPKKSNHIFLHILQGFHSLAPFLLKSIESSMSKLSSTLFVGHFSGMFFLLQDISGIEFLQK